MNKPLKDWTLGEVQELCKKQASCGVCAFSLMDTHKGFICELRCSPPSLWGVTDPPRFTEQEVADAKTIMRLFHGVESVYRTDNGRAQLMRYIDGSVLHICLSAFPSVKAGETVKLSDIVGGENEVDV